MKLFLRDKVPSNYNRATWLDIVSQVERQVNDLSEGRVSAYHGKATAAPTIGEWVRGDWVKNSLPSSSGLFGWICTESGSPGTWLGFGLIEPFGSGGGISLPIGAQNVTFFQSGAGATSETVQGQLQNWIHISQFGGGALESAATNTTALQNAIAWAQSVGNGSVLIGPGGTWAFTADTNFAASGVSIVGIGKPTLDFSASTADNGFKLDGVSSYVQGMVVKNFIIKGGANIANCFHVRRVVRSLFENIQVKNCTDNGFSLRHNVLNTFINCAISDDIEAQTTRPSNYWLLESDGTVDNHTQANTFINCEASGHGSGSTKTGWALENAILNVWVCGTAESVAVGLDIRNDVCRNNSWYGFDLEDNQTNDLKVKGYGNAFYTSFAQSACSDTPIRISTGINTKFSGGYIRQVDLEATSSDTEFSSVMFDDNASRGIQGSGSFKRYNCIKNTGGVGGNKTGTYLDVLGVSESTTLVGGQGGDVASTVTKNEVTVTGRIVNIRGNLAFTAAGTGGNSIAVTTLAGYAAKSTVVGLPVGQFVYDDAGTRYVGAVWISAANTLVFRVDSSTDNFGINPAITIASGDVLSFTASFPLE